MKQDLFFRKAQEEDVSAIWEIILQAKAQMKHLGSQQWNDDYPKIETIQEDIQRGEAYVLATKKQIATYGVVSFQGEPVYEQIQSWANSLPYLIVHRLAVADSMKRQGLAGRFMQEAEEVARQNGIQSFRVDTNFDNTYMLRLLDNMGFEYRGEVVYRGNEVRKAFDKSIRTEASFFGLPGYTIREAMLEDAQAIYETIDQHRKDLREWLPFVDMLQSVKDEEAFLSPILSVRYEERDCVFVLEKGKSLCGLIGFHFSDRTNQRTEIGYWLSPEYRGKGIITQAVNYLCHWAMFERGFNRIQIRCATANHPSNAIPKRLGFTWEGTERDGELLSSGQYTDIHVYSLLKKDLTE